jgi:AraC-like DNA-binding protein
MGSSVRRQPLVRFPALRTSSVEKIREVLASIYVMPAMLPKGRKKAFEANVNNCQLRDIALAYTAYGVAARLDFPESNYFSQRFPTRGKGEIAVGKTRTTLSVGRGIPIPSSISYSEYINDDYEQLVLRINSQALTKKLAAFVGAPICTALRVEPVQNIVYPPVRGLYHLFLYLIGTMDSADATLPSLVMAELEQAVMMAFLIENRHNYSHLFECKPHSVAPWQVRRAEEYVEANWNRAIRMEDIAAVTGASARSIFRTFKQSRGCTPMVFAKRLRLRRAQEMLLASGPTASVTDIALACGFGDLGRFSKDYREAFGEPPSKALNRAKSTFSARI